METMTTLPVESMNRMLKSNVHSNLNLSKSVNITTRTFDERFDNHRKTTLRETNPVPMFRPANYCVAPSRVIRKLTSILPRASFCSSPIPCTRPWGDHGRKFHISASALPWAWLASLSVSSSVASFFTFHHHRLCQQCQLCWSVY